LLDDIEIVLMDVKAGRSPLSKWQKAIAQAVRAGRMRFEVARVDDEGRLDRKPFP
jgi:predicted Holliday junction resolvase-like endonuclease